MIVKNESKIIKETLSNILNYIDYWIISDTGSTDNTVEIIENYFKELNIKGKIFYDKWVDFGTNRTIALRHALNNSKDFGYDYIFIMDADDIIKGELIWPENMDADCYYLKFGCTFTYLRQQVFSCASNWRYRGVVHEYPECIGKTNIIIKKIDSNYYIESRRLGNRNLDPNKYLNDALKMEKALELNSDPDLKTRYLFYIAQSYWDYGDYFKSLEWYKKRVKSNGWIEEIYYSLIRIGECMIKLNFEHDSIVKTFLNAISLIKERPESYFNLACYFEKKSEKELDEKQKIKLFNSSYFYLTMLSKISYIKSRDINRLFLNKEIFDWTGKFKLAEISFKLEKYVESKNLCEEILINTSERLNYKIYENVETLKYKVMKKIVEKNENNLTSYPHHIVEKLIYKMYDKSININLNKRKIICTMTTCKRLNLFLKTINSFLNCCKDIDMIDDWLFIDDNSSQEDIDIMRYEYPFIRWIFKNKEQKGHSVSMNMIRELTKDYDYIIHLEDDWEFIEKTYYIKPSLDILESNKYIIIDDNANEKIIEDKKIVQVLFNKNYAENFDHIVWGGFLMQTDTNMKTKFLLHEYYTNSTNHKLSNKINCAYWPHYSFRPSIFKREILNDLGEYDLEGFFERKYADKFYSSNYLSCFFDKITCLHIGKLTNTDGINAYSLNNIKQFDLSKSHNNLFNVYKKNFIFLPNLDVFGNDILYFKSENIDELINISSDLDDCLCFNTYGYFKNKLSSNLIEIPNKFFKPDGLFINVIKTHDEIICLNLKRRTDRKEKIVILFNNLNLKYRIYEAIDGFELKPTQELNELFKSNDFGSKRGVIGCAMSHLNIWKELIDNKLRNYYLILEDDVELHLKFKEYLNIIQNKLNEISEPWDILFLSYSMYDNKKNLYNLIDKNENVEIKIIDFDNSNYIGGFFGYIISKSGAIKLVNYINSNGIKHGIDYLIKIIPELKIYQLEKFIIYTNWVQSYDSTVDSDIQKNNDFLDIYSDKNFQYIRGLDSSDNDLYFFKTNNLDELKQKALEDKNCVCFNSLGFFKSKLNELKTTPYFCNMHDGVYIKKSEFNENLNENTNENTIRVKMICNWTDSKTLCDEWNWMSKGNYMWNDIEITWEDKNIDYYVIINKPKENDFYVKEKTIVYQMEPLCNNHNQTWGVKTWGEWANPNPNEFLMVRTSKNYLNNVLWQFNLTYNYFKNEKIVKNEELLNTLSSICSSKYYDPGHIKRIDFLKYLEEKNDINFDIHIWNQDNLHVFKSYKGKLSSYVDKHNGIIPYKYYFMCENNSEKNFITEKLWEPIICETLVFYWGCPNVDEYINPLAYVQLDMDDFEKSYQIIKESIENNLWEDRIKYIKQEKEKILDYYNFFPTLERIIK